MRIIEVLAAWILCQREQTMRMGGVFCEGQTDGFQAKAEKAFQQISDALEDLRKLNAKRAS